MGNWYEKRMRAKQIYLKKRARQKQRKCVCKRCKDRCPKKWIHVSFRYHGNSMVYFLDSSLGNTVFLEVLEGDKFKVENGGEYLGCQSHSL